MSEKVKKRNLQRETGMQRSKNTVIVKTLAKTHLLRIQQLTEAYIFHVYTYIQVKNKTTKKKTCIVSVLWYLIVPSRIRF